MTIRHATEADAEALATILNAIIEEGGKTAIDGPLSPQELAEWFMSGPHCVTCMVAVDENGHALGFQTTERFHDDLPSATADIGTFIAKGARGSRIGKQLADATFAAARQAGLDALRAVIRRENKGAVAFYRALGFQGHVPREGAVVLVRTLELEGRSSGAFTV
ncbi:GNAT family N-acetyltransferase [Rhodococcus rhodnii]|uniref:N-acetyltransferase domain-containing protein n=2 Tax=Rhodococcus rhodnii TaxID=38312 RepID=R7WLS1_9NOCA|nr:GNAT family N-acetyltransferase [Rhodococcus rhodnii]EOM76266.1 hypothetical protein Rrhod_2366 [Rhodococcus rhodnii LMG 5362]TXG90743.1 GNAT family N-acetyltransferase [Rhodococcus rhodnii]